MLSAHDLGMDAQLAALKAVCGHQSLSAAVPVEFDVSFAPLAGFGLRAARVSSFTPCHGQ